MVQWARQGIDLSHASTPTVQVGAAWRAMTNAERMSKVYMTLGSGAFGGVPGMLDVVSARADGPVVLSMHQSFTAKERGQRLMELEHALKDRIDPGITVYLEPKGDKNILRAQTRGIEVKAI